MMVLASGLWLFHSSFMVISSRLCQRHLTQHYGDSTPRSSGVILATLSPLIKPFVYRLLLFDTSCPCSLSSRLFLPCHLWLPPLISSSTSVSSNHLTPFQIHPHQLADSVHFTRRAQCSDPRESMADKSMLSLFSMPLLPSIFFFLLLCCLWRLELCSIKLSSLSGTNCNSVRLSARRQTLMLALDGAYKSFIYEMPRWNRSCSGFY